MATLDTADQKLINIYPLPGVGQFPYTTLDLPKSLFPGPTLQPGQAKSPRHAAFPQSRQIPSHRGDNSTGIPSPNEIADLRANVAKLEARGGKIQLVQCGPSNRLCAKIDVKANKSTGRLGHRGAIHDSAGLLIGPADYKNRSSPS